MFSRQKEIIKTREEKDEIETEKPIEQINETKRLFFFEKSF